MTPQRRVILDELRRLESHPTAREVYDRVRRRMPRVSLGTVYRNLEFFSRLGVIRTVEVGPSERRYDGREGDHDHVRCIQCGRIENVPVVPLGKLEATAAAASGYKVTGHRLGFEGICPDCQASNMGLPATCPDEGITH